MQNSRGYGSGGVDPLWWSMGGTQVLVFTNARICALIRSGRSSQAVTTFSRSGFFDTLGTHFSCVDVLGFCCDSAEFCSPTVSGDFANALDCLDFASFCWDSA